MKTIEIRFSVNKAKEVGILLHSLELKVLATWCEDSLLDATQIFCILRLNSDSSAITPELQTEKLREKMYIKIL